uniref:CorA-like transporter domain-containing protein n=1 Tax=Bionectria ochroleuca TaxID=29856 RepID=A0A8H7K6S0_BIOOC
MFDDIVRDCEKADSWPLCPSMQGGVQATMHSLNQIYSQLTLRRKSLFSTDLAKFRLLFWEGYPTQSHCQFREVRSLDSLKQHLNQHIHKSIKDPIVRYIFISAGNSRKPLNCTLEAFCFLCTYLQVSPEYADTLLSFGEPSGDIVEFHQPSSYQEYFITPVAGTFLKTPELGRSGWELRNIYKLSAMEFSADGYFMRQQAVHHSFDFATGKALFIITKANHNAIQGQIEAIGKGAVPESTARSFLDSLETQLISFTWCADGWREYIGVLEPKIRQISRRMHNISISSEDEHVNFNHGGQSASSANPDSPKEIHNGTGQRLRSLKCISSILSDKFRWINSKKRLGTSSTIVVEPKKTKAASERLQENTETIQNSTKRIKILEEFPFSGLQKLASARQNLEEIKLVMALNIGVLVDVREFYKHLFEAAEFPPGIKECHATELQTFLRRIQCSEKKLSTQCQRVDALIHITNDGKNLVCLFPFSVLTRSSLILEYSITQSINLFTMDALRTSIRMESSAKRMEDIAQSTERDTASMHVITFFALVFLPGTLLGED